MAPTFFQVSAASEQVDERPDDGSQETPKHGLARLDAFCGAEVRVRVPDYVLLGPTQQPRLRNGWPVGRSQYPSDETQAAPGSGPPELRRIHPGIVFSHKASVDVVVSTRDGDSRHADDQHGPHSKDRSEKFAHGRSFRKGWNCTSRPWHGHAFAPSHAFCILPPSQPCNQTRPDVKDAGEPSGGQIRQGEADYDLPDIPVLLLCCPTGRRCGRWRTKGDDGQIQALILEIRIVCRNRLDPGLLQTGIVHGITPQEGRLRHSIDHQLACAPCDGKILSPTASLKLTERPPVLVPQCNAGGPEGGIGLELRLDAVLVGRLGTELLAMFVPHQDEEPLDQRDWGEGQLDVQ